VSQQQRLQPQMKTPQPQTQHQLVQTPGTDPLNLGSPSGAPVTPVTPSIPTTPALGTPGPNSLFIPGTPSTLSPQTPAQKPPQTPKQKQAIPNKSTPPAEKRSQPATTKSKGFSWDKLKAQQTQKWQNKEQNPEPEKEVQQQQQQQQEEPKAVLKPLQPEPQNPEPTEDKKEDEGEELGDVSLSDDDDPEQEDTSDNIVICTFENKSRVKNKWKVQLKHGVISIDGKDYLFNRASLEGEW